MAKCSQCSRDIGCACNLIGGICMSCYNKNINGDNPQPIKQRKSSKRVVYNNIPKAPPNNQFSEILKSQGLSRQEKLRRINEILEKAREQI